MGRWPVAPALWLPRRLRGCMEHYGAAPSPARSGGGWMRLRSRAGWFGSPVDEVLTSSQCRGAICQSGEGAVAKKMALAGAFDDDALRRLKVATAIEGNTSGLGSLPMAGASAGQWTGRPVTTPLARISCLF